MHRRPLVYERDYDQLLAMQRYSWQINFPGQVFCEVTFSLSLRLGNQGEVYIYELDGQIVGWLWLDWSSKRAGHIRHIQVEQAYWGQGFGRQIMQDALSLCRAHGYRAITLNVTKANIRAMALYAHLGFVVVEHNGERQCMRLDLPEHGKVIVGERGGA